jgi:hypothetical protein
MSAAPAPTEGERRNPHLDPAERTGIVLTYVTKLLIVPALAAVALTGLVTFLACRALIGMCVRREPEEDPA